MAMMDTVKRLMAGKSEVVERSIDKAVDYLGRSNEALKRQAETVKARARALDPDNPDAASSGGAPTSGSPAAADPPGAPAVALPPPPLSPPAPPSEPSSGAGLRGDLVDPPEEAPPA